jgi:hypothetical protein
MALNTGQGQVLIEVELLKEKEWVGGRKSELYVWGEHDGELSESASVGRAVGTLLFGCSTIVFGSVLLVTWLAMRRSRMLQTVSDPAHAPSE